MPPKTIAYSISHAVDGLTHCLRTQRHMRLHFGLAFAVMVTAVLLQVSGPQLLTLLFSVILIIVAEMFNTGIEVVVDLVTPHYDPRAKIIKDVSAGAVLLSGLNAAVISLLVFLHSPVIESLRQRKVYPQYSTNWGELCVETLLILCIIAAVWRMRGSDGSVPKGSPISARAAFAFCGMLLIVFNPNDEVRLIAVLFMMLLIIHGGSATRTYTVRQVALGAVLGAVVPGLVLVAHYAFARPEFSGARITRSGITSSRITRSGITLSKTSGSGAASTPSDGAHPVAPRPANGVTGPLTAPKRQNVRPLRIDRSGNLPGSGGSE